MSDRTPHPYDELERDLTQLAARRAKDGVLSVTQLTGETFLRYMIAMAALAEVSGLLAGYYAAHYKKEGDPLDLAVAAIEAMKSMRDEPESKP